MRKQDPDSPATAVVSFDEYLYLASLLTSRAFSVGNDPDNVRVCCPALPAHAPAYSARK